MFLISYNNLINTFYGVNPSNQYVYLENEIHKTTVIISIQGVKGSFHDEAASLIFGATDLLERDTFDEVFSDCVQNKCDFAIVAIENSIVGSLIYNYDRLFRYNLHIVAETYLRISHYLIAAPDALLTDIKEIWSHPMAIEQCRAFLATLPAKVVETEDTAGSVKKLMVDRPQHIAAIASKRSAQIYFAHVLVPAIETDPHNYTRFLVLSRSSESRPITSKNTKSSLLVRVPDKAGSLYTLLGLITEAGVNLSKIESRPRIGLPWKYDFYLDLDLDGTEPAGQSLIATLQQETEFVKVLGTYPRFGDLTPGNV